MQAKNGMFEYLLISFLYLKYVKNMNHKILSLMIVLFIIFSFNKNESTSWDTRIKTQAIGKY